MSGQSKGRPGGVLPIPAAATKKTNVQKYSQRSPAPKLRLIIRRLPPGLTDSEFWEALGSEWQTGNGKVDWHVFKEGKITKDPSKPSRPGRAYLRVKDQTLLEFLSAKVKSTSFKDAKNTGNDPCLVGPPALEFAPYNKVPSGRNRHDGRQGTIDQDQEFIDFLQSLTEPITKATVDGADTAETKQEKVITTPLVQFIKEKKANKAKEKEAAAAAKSSKKNQEGKETKSKGESRPTVVVKSSAASAEKTKIAKVTQETVKIASKAAAQIQAKYQPSKADSKPTKETPPPASAPATTPTPKPERQRGSASAASRLIARDLGLAPKEARAPRAARTATNTFTTGPSESTPKSEPSKQSAPQTPTTTSKVTAMTTVPAAATTSTSTSTSALPPTGPRGNRTNQTTTPAKATPAAAQRSSKAPPQPSAGAKSAFLKHANPSQGITEELLRTAFTKFGEVTRCEIDKKKGLGYIDFAEPEPLKKAMAASPVKIGNGQVVVLENRSPYQKRGQQAQAQGSAASVQSQAGASTSKAASAASSVVASAVTSPQPAPATIATVQPATTAPIAIETKSTPDANSVPTVATPVTPTTPSTPATPSGTRGNSASRGRGGTNFNGQRGGFNQTPNRGRGGHRGRGGGRAARGGAAAATTGAENAGATGAKSSPNTPASTGGKGSGSGGGDAAKAAGDKA